MDCRSAIFGVLALQISASACIAAAMIYFDDCIRFARMLGSAPLPHGTALARILRSAMTVFLWNLRIAGMKEQAGAFSGRGHGDFGEQKRPTLYFSG
jgi:hypothetical protein